MTSACAPSQLEVLCACLMAGEQGRALDPAAAAALSDPSFDFLRFAGLAGRHLATPMLAACFARPELARAAPEDFRLYVAFMHAQNRQRNAALAAELAAAATALNRIGVEPALLKGAARLADGLYPDAGRRFMRDLDLLVPRAQADAAAAALQAEGYAFVAEAAEWPEDHRHLPGLARGGGTAIELHRDLLPARRALCPAEDVLARARPIAFGGARVRLPERVDQLAHLIAHDRLDRALRRSGSFLLRSLFETALLCREPGAAERLLARFAACGLRRWAGAHLELANALFPGAFAAPQATWSERLRVGVALRIETMDSAWSLRAGLMSARRSMRDLASARGPAAWADRAEAIRGRERRPAADPRPSGRSRPGA